MSVENEYKDGRYDKDRFLSNIPSLKPMGVSDEDWVSIDDEYPYIGIDTALFLVWAAKNDLLDKKINNVVILIYNAMEKKTHQTIINIMLDTVGHMIFTYHFKEKTKHFGCDYLQYFIWKYDIHEDVKKHLSPETRTISEIPETEEMYSKVFSFFDKRYLEYQKDSKLGNVK